MARSDTLTQPDRRACKGGWVGIRNRAAEKQRWVSRAFVMEVAQCLALWSVRRRLSYRQQGEAPSVRHAKLTRDRNRTNRETHYAGPP